MPSITNAIYLKPSDDKEFENMIRDLFALHWKDDNTQIRGRSGQSQNGVDVYGYPNKSSALYGIQCKLRNDSKLKKTEIEEEILEARNFTPKLDTLIFATTMNRDTKIQDLIFEFNRNEKALGSFNIQIKFWEDICGLLNGYREIILKYYSEYLIYRREIENKPLISYQETPSLLLGFLFDVSSSMSNTLYNLPAESISEKDFQKAVNLLTFNANQYLKTNESVGILSGLSIFAYGYGLGKIRKSISDIANLLGIGKRDSKKDEIISSSPVRDLFSEIAVKESLPYTPNIIELNNFKDKYQLSVQSQFTDVGHGYSILYEALVLIKKRFETELLNPFYKYPTLVILTDGNLERASDEELSILCKELESFGVKIFILFVGNETIQNRKTLSSEFSSTWSEKAIRGFKCSSLFDESNIFLKVIKDAATNRGWVIPENARLFFHSNQPEILEEFIEILLSPVSYG